MRSVWSSCCSGLGFRQEECKRRNDLIRHEVGHRHIRIANRLDFEDVEVLCEGVKLRVEAVEHVRHLLCLDPLRDLGEAHDVAEKNANLVPVLRLHLGSGFRV
jgi:hypothetical protein